MAVWKDAGFLHTMEKLILVIYRPEKYRKEKREYGQIFMFPNYFPSTVF